MKKLPLLVLFCAALGASVFAADAKKNVLMIAGRPSHGPGEHEHNAGIQLLAKCLGQGAADRVDVKFHLNAEWPSAEELAKADTVVIYSDGGGGHPAASPNHLAQLGKEMKRGCGFVCLHYAVEVEKEKGGPEFTDWLGGYFEKNWSVNPHWDAGFKSLPAHEITSGVNPFGTNDEWYFHMRFREGMKGVTPILTAVAPERMGRAARGWRPRIRIHGRTCPQGLGQCGAAQARAERDRVEREGRGADGWHRVENNRRGSCSESRSEGRSQARRTEARRARTGEVTPALDAHSAAHSHAHPWQPPSENSAASS